MGRIERLLAALMLSGFAGTTAAGQSAADSGSQRVALLELYTSEGCDSCPPADQWLTELPRRGYHRQRVVTLAFHVDYWNSLRWIDPFSKPQYSVRQKTASLRSRARGVYTPQFLLNGRAYRRPTLRDEFDVRLDTFNREAAGTWIRVQLVTEESSRVQVTGTAKVSGAADRNAARAWTALYENNLSNQIIRGENRGRRLRHDFVVRHLAGPSPVDARGEATWERHFDLIPAWKTGDLYVARSCRASAAATSCKHWPCPTAANGTLKKRATPSARWCRSR